MDMVKSWHQEKQHYSFPHPRECNPRCPSKCSGSVCSHYTQVSTAAPRDPAAKGGLVQLTALLPAAAGIQDQILAAASFQSGSGPGNWQCVCCRDAGDAIPPWAFPAFGLLQEGLRGSQRTEEQLGPSGQLTRRFPLF